MDSTAKKISIDELAILSLKITKDEITASISDGRTVSIPIAWFPLLENASKSDLSNFEISPSGYGIHWPTLDEDISIQSFINP
jgi:hypothetical protein